MDMDGMDMSSDMSMMEMGSVSLTYLQQMYWAVIGSAVGFAALVNLSNRLLARQRLSSCNAKPQGFFATAMATSTAICREISYAPLGEFRTQRFTIPATQLGRVILVLSNLVMILVLCFYKQNTLDQWSWEDIGYQTGCIAVCQLPLLFLLAGKQNIIGLLTGFGYERLNWLHRWTARTLWLTVTIHMGFWFRSWARYDYIITKIKTDPLTQRGLAAWVILTVILLLSFAPVRRLNYELFVVTHLITFAGFIGAVWIHVPSQVKIYVWISIGLYFFDRLLRSCMLLYSNLTIFHWQKRKNNDVPKGLWANKATLTVLPGNMTRITIDKPAISWKPGQHVFLACHSVVPLQSHPFTIASLPSDDKMEFLIRAEKGGTKRFLSHASKLGQLPVGEREAKQDLKAVAIEGPYGRMRDLKQFDSVVLLAGSNGATFTVPLMRDIVHDWLAERSCCYKPSKWAPSNLTVTRRIRFVWVIRSRDQLSWFSEQLDRVLQDVGKQYGADALFDKEVEMSIYVTCDEDLVAERTKAGTCCAPATISHGQVEEVDSAKETNIGEKDKGDIVEVQSINSSTPTTSMAGGGCNPDGTCCCKSTNTDEDEEHICTCGHVVKSESTRNSKASLPSINEKTPEILEPSRANPPLRIVSGRPHPKTIIRKVLEEAEGESAVVVCGPRGLRDDVRNSVVSLSDERAVHKGTGAQGIYLHVEGFDY